MTIVATVLALAITAVGVFLFARMAARITSVVRLGQPTLGRNDNAGARWRRMFVETLGHTKMLQRTAVGAAHWFVFVAFGALFFTLLTAFGQLFNPEFALPVIGHWIVYEWLSELIAWLGLFAILALIAYRLVKGESRSSRFFGSRRWQAVYVEWTILGIVVCVLTLRALEFQLGDASRWHFPLTSFLLPGGISDGALQTAIVFVAALKIIVSMAWFCVLGLNATMGVAWHRFTAWPNIWFGKHADGKPALGELSPINSGGKPIDFEEIEDLDEISLGVGKVEDFTWKGLLDFTSCTECGRCQDQCPAWNTEKPLSPKLLIMGLREHAYAKAPYLQAAEAARASLPAEVLAEAERPLVGPNPDAVAQAHGKPIQIVDGVAGVIDADVLWSCTSCGACVQQCPVDIEHVDHIMDMRRFQVMVAEEFPSELNTLYKGLESRGNPWKLNAKGRMDWAKDLGFTVPVVGEDVEDLNEVEYLFWVGCAGAFEDRAKKTTQAVAELLHRAGVSFAVLGKAETCTGDPARRSGNEFVYQQLAGENVATLTEAQAKKVVTTCAHCLNTLKNEYPQLGANLDVVHHTQLLNRLVREGKLTPVAALDSSVGGRSITYHDPCFLGRHNEVYSPPRDLLTVLPGSTVTEMPRNSEKSFCCGAGGAQMWMEEKLGSRINLNRTKEAMATGADTIATGCPFCRIMLSDGVAAETDGDESAKPVEVMDVSQLLLESVRRGDDASSPA